MPLQQLLSAVLHTPIPTHMFAVVVMTYVVHSTVSDVCSHSLLCVLSVSGTVASQLTVLCVPVGFLHGLCDADLPDTYTGLGRGIRPHVLSTQKVLDPFSPFLLELPPTLPPMWSTFSSPEGARDVVQGNLIPAGQRTSLLQCSRYRNSLCVCTHVSCAVL